MNEIKVRGKLIDSWGAGTSPLGAEWKEAEILIALPTQEELGKLKEGDEVLVKYKIKSIGKLGEWCYLADNDFMFPIKSIVAILPPQPTEEYINKIGDHAIDLLCRCGGFKARWAKKIICSICHKPLPSLDDPEPLPPKPKQEEIEELDMKFALSEFIHEPTRIQNEILIIKDKLNDLIQAVNEMRKEK